MSQSLLYHAFGVREGYEYRKTEYVEGRVEFHLAVKEEMLRCPEADTLGRTYLKSTRYLLLAGAENVPDERREALAEALRFNQPLATAYYLKEDLRALWSQPTATLMRRHLDSWCQRALESGITQMVTMAQTLRTHATGILNYREHPISTGKLEGINNKIKTLKRKAYGFRDEAFFILKLYSLHESKAVLTGV